MFRHSRTFYSLSAISALLVGISLSAKADDSIYFRDAGNSAAVTIKFLHAGNLYEESTVAGDYNIFINGSATATAAFCTDVYDNIYYGETWNAQQGLTSDLLQTTTYSPPAMNIAAIDYIAQNYTPTPYAPAPTAAAAQLAIWDLVTGGQVTKDMSGNYAWDTSVFSATAGFANVSDQTDLASVFSIEHEALYTAPSVLRTGSSGSLFFKPTSWSGTSGPDAGRPQDLVTGGPPLPHGQPVPEASTLLSFGGLLGVGGLGLFIRRRRTA